MQGLYENLVLDSPAGKWCESIPSQAAQPADDVSAFSIASSPASSWKVPFSPNKQAQGLGGPDEPQSGRQRTVVSGIPRLGLYSYPDEAPASLTLVV